MSINPITAAQFYSTARNATQADQSGSSQSGGIGQFAAELAQTVQQGENVAKAAMSGNADMPTLVEAIAKSELAVETAVTIRDRVVEAYQEILRMPV